MSVFGKLAFWKKKEEPLGGEDFGLGAAPGEGFGKEFGFGGDAGKGPDLGITEQGFGEGFPEQQTIKQPSMPRETATGYMRETPINAPSARQGRAESYGYDREMELISSKIDAIRAEIQTINQRLANIERMVEDARERQRRTW